MVDIIPYLRAEWKGENAAGKEVEFQRNRGAITGKLGCDYGEIGVEFGRGERVEMCRGIPSTLCIMWRKFYIHIS